MLLASTFGSRGLVLGASALLHVAVFAVAANTKLPSAGLSLVDTNGASEIAIDTEPPPVAEIAQPIEHHHAHTHAYPVAPDHDAIDHDESVVHTPYVPHDAADHDHDHPADAPSDVVTAPAAALPNFSISIGTSTTAHGVVQNAAAGNGAAPRADADAPVEEAHVSSGAHLLSSMLPAYPTDAREEGIEADVPLEIVVDKSGAVKSASPLAHAGYGFDESALAAIHHYRFSPAARGGQVVSVRMRWVVQFRLK